MLDSRAGRDSTLRRVSDDQHIDELLPIGRFARQAGLSIGALRHYDALEKTVRRCDVVFQIRGRHAADALARHSLPTRARWRAFPRSWLNTIRRPHHERELPRPCLPSNRMLTKKS